MRSGHVLTQPRSPMWRSAGEKKPAGALSQGLTLFATGCGEVGARGIIQNSRDLSGEPRAGWRWGAGGIQGNGWCTTNVTKRIRKRTTLQGLKPASKL